MRRPRKSYHGPLMALVVAHLRAHGDASCRELAEALDRDWCVVNDTLRALFNRGELVKTGPHKRVRWSLPVSQ